MNLIVDVPNLRRSQPDYQLDLPMAAMNLQMHSFMIQTVHALKFI